MFKFIKTAILAAALVAQAASACEVKDARVCAIADKVLAYAPAVRVQFKEYSTQPLSVAAQYEWGLYGVDTVHLGLTRDYDEDALFYLVAHEIGHSKLKHGRATVESVAAEADKLALSDLDLYKKYGTLAIQASDSSANRALNHSQEFDADKFAVELMVRHGIDPVSAMRKVLKVAGSSIGYPSRRDRIERAKAIAAEQVKTLAQAQ